MKKLVVICLLAASLILVGCASTSNTTSNKIMHYLRLSEDAEYKCASPDYLITTLGETTNETKKILSYINSKSYDFSNTSESIPAMKGVEHKKRASLCRFNLTSACIVPYNSTATSGEANQCTYYHDGTNSITLHLKIKNCLALFNCTLKTVQRDSEFVIGPYKSNYGNYLERKGKLYKVKIEGRSYLSNTPNPSDDIKKYLSDLIKETNSY